MLAADKLLLRSKIAQRSVVLKEKEFGLHHGNFRNVGTQAAVMAGFSVTALIEFGPPEGGSRALKFFFYLTMMLSLAANVLCVANTTLLSVWGTGLAMRGPNGSMIRAVDGMYRLRRDVFVLMSVGMVSSLLMGIFGAWILFEAAPALALSGILAASIYAVIRAQRYLYRLFYYRDDEATSFEDIEPDDRHRAA